MSQPCTIYDYGVINTGLQNTVCQETILEEAVVRQSRSLLIALVALEEIHFIVLLCSTQEIRKYQISTFYYGFLPSQLIFLKRQNSI